MKVVQYLIEDHEDDNSVINEIIDKAVERTTVVIRQMIQEALRDQAAESSEKWVNTKEAQKILCITSKKKMQELRDHSPQNGILLSKNGRTYIYERDSLLAYADKNRIK